MPVLPSDRPSLAGRFAFGSLLSRLGFVVFSRRARPGKLMSRPRHPKTCLSEAFYLPRIKSLPGRNYL